VAKIGIKADSKEEKGMRTFRESMMTIAGLAGLGILMLLANPLLAAELDYPAKPVILNVGFAPGASASITGHIFAEGVQKYLPKPQPFIINHKPGASGMIAADYFMKQPADGYNLMWTPQDSYLRMALEPQKFSFTLKDFSYMGAFTYSPFTLSVNSESPFKAFEEFVEYAKKHPYEMTLSTPGIATGGHFTAEVFMKGAGIKLTHVPFAAGNPATLAMLGGHVTCTLMSIGTLSPHLKGGKARALVVFSEKRYPEFPDVPTCKEKGYDVLGFTWYSFVARKGTPKPVLDTLAQLLKQTADDTHVKSTLVNAGLVPWYLSPEETEKKVNQDYELFREIFGKLGLLGK
jgi:tripartite-type tricarboxylate transporter receptor subunit TctC